MRLSPICLAIALSLLGGCQKSNPVVTEPASDATGSGAEVTAANAAATAAEAAAAAEVDQALAAHEPAANLARQAAARADRRSRAEKSLSKLGIVDRKADVTSYLAPLAPPPAPVGLTMPTPAELSMGSPRIAPPPPTNTERYASIEDNPVRIVAQEPVSTFSIDVDTGSYSNVRRMLLAGERPPADAVRAEEMINYFDYGYPAPANREVPFRVSTEIATAPWNSRRQLVQVGIQGYRVAASEIPAANLVFLIDTSGSMQDEDKLPLLKRSFSELARKLRPQDRVSIVVYAGSAGVVLTPTPGDRQDLILGALDRLEAGGSTNGGQGLQLAYAMARSAFLARGVNRVILATDGDFNVGTVDQKALETMVAEQRKGGIALTTLGFGTGNYNDAMAEQLADIGNGNHAYVDSIDEGRKVLVEEMSSTMLTIAEDVKIQVEFNPSVVAEYRLIGYENRALRREDFNNDRVDAGEIGAGHDVTALYEITLVGSGAASVDPLRYAPKTAATSGTPGKEIGWLRLRYKAPGAGTSRLIETPLLRSQLQAKASPRLRWSAAVAAYADLLRGGSHVGGFGWSQVRALAAGAVSDDRWGHRAQFLELVDRARAVTGDAAPVAVAE